MKRSRTTRVAAGWSLFAMVAGGLATACGSGGITTEAAPSGDAGAPRVSAMSDGQTAKAIDAAMIGTLVEAGVIIQYNERSSTPPYWLTPAQPPANPELINLAYRINQEQRAAELELLSTTKDRGIALADSPLSAQLDEELRTEIGALFRARGVDRDQAYIASTIRSLIETKGLIDDIGAAVHDESLRGVVERAGTLIATELPAAYEAQRRVGPNI